MILLPHFAIRVLHLAIAEAVEPATTPPIETWPLGAVRGLCREAGNNKYMEIMFAMSSQQSASQI